MSAAAAIAVGVTVGLGVSGAQAASTPGWRFVEVYPQAQWFDAVSASSAANAWAVGVSGPAGSSCTSTCLFTSHWNGKKWQTIPEPNGLQGPGIYIGNVGVAATTGERAWVFATRENSDGNGAGQVAAVEWTGTSWSAVHSFGASYLTVAIASGPDDVWGFGFTGSTSSTPWAVHYNGKTWSRVSVPVVVSDASGSAATGDWIIGSLVPAPGNGQDVAVLHWSKGAWKRVPLPKIPVPKGRISYGPMISAVTASDVWARVYVSPPAGPGPVTDYLLHWNGKAWAKVSLPKGVLDGDLVGDGHGGYWDAWNTYDKNGNPSGVVVYHDSAGRWTRAAVSVKAGFVPQLDGDLQLIPGTRSVLSGATLYPGSNLGGTGEGAILQYGP